MTRFQILLLGIFTFFIVAGVLIFATFQGFGGKQSPPVLLWGTLPEEIIRNLAENEVFKQSGVQINYLEKDPATLDRDFVEALAEGRGPDLILLPQNLLYKERNKLALISYDAFPAREFKDTFAESAEVLLSSEGIWGIPFSIDPMVLYWNRTIFSDVGIAEPPRFWDEVSSLTPKLSLKDNNLNVRRAAIALGTFSNVNHAKEILATLFLQTGNKIVSGGGSGGEWQATIKDFGSGKMEEALSFYTGFADAAKGNYTWNGSLHNSIRAFSEGTLSMYLGFAGELSDIRRRNPNLNFDVAALPQARGESRAAYAAMEVLAIPRQSRNPAGAYSAARLLTSVSVLSQFAEQSNLPPVRRDLLRLAPKDAYKAVFYESALSAKVWVDPDPERSALVFKDLIESVNSGRASVSEALGVADRGLSILLQ